MRPDSRLNAVLGIGDAAGTTSNGYTLIDQADIGAGLQSLTLPFKGDARHFALAGATPVSTLYSSATPSNPAGPAVVRYGRTAAWAFDLARSTAYTRQGNPADAGIERDGLPLLRTTDLFFQRIDLGRVGIPHADVQMRLFSRVIAELLADTPAAAAAVVLPGQCPHGDGPHRRQPCRVRDGQLRGFISARRERRRADHGYMARFINLLASPARPGQATATSSASIRSSPRTASRATSPRATRRGSTGSHERPPPVTPGPTVRHHTLEWAGWVDAGDRDGRPRHADGPLLLGLRSGRAPDPGRPAAQAHGYITGSGLPMRFIDGDRRRAARLPAGHFAGR